MCGAIVSVLHKMLKNRRETRLLHIFLFLLLLTACSGPSYYTQAISGQWKLMHSRQDIQTLLNDPATDPELAVQLRTAQKIKQFANHSLDLPSNGSYASYVEVDGDALVWIVVATREFSLQAKQWCFLVAGCVPYRGFFKQQKAEDSAAQLRKKGMDVLVSPSAAYSSLGWFNDPLLSTMFSASDVRLAAYLFHELAHQRLYVKDDGVFNEGYASFVEEIGLTAWLESENRQDELIKWQQLQAAAKDLSVLVGHTHSELTSLYNSAEPEDLKRQLKADAFAALLDSLQGTRYYPGWSEQPLNNARLALYATYEGSYCAFQRLWNDAAGEPREFHRLAEQKSRLQKDQREKWLKQSCEPLLQ